MKTSFLIVSLSLAGFCHAATAATTDNIAVYATETSQGSISVGGKDAYTKTFDVALATLSGNSVDLTKYCLKAYSPDHRVFQPDTIDDTLTTGSLKAGKLVKGSVVFASEDSAVMKAALVKITDSCD